MLYRYFLFNPKNSFYPIPRRIFTTARQFLFSSRTIQDSDLDLVMSWVLPWAAYTMVTSGKQRPVDVAQVVWFMRCED